MKKLLLGATALVAAALMAGPAMSSTAHLDAIGLQFATSGSTVIHQGDKLATPAQDSAIKTTATQIKIEGAEAVVMAMKSNNALGVDGKKKVFDEGSLLKGKTAGTDGTTPKQQTATGPQQAMAIVPSLGAHQVLGTNSSPDLAATTAGATTS